MYQNKDLFQDKVLLFYFRTKFAQKAIEISE